MSLTLSAAAFGQHAVPPDKVPNSWSRSAASSARSTRDSGPLPGVPSNNGSNAQVGNATTGSAVEGLPNAGSGKAPPTANGVNGTVGNSSRTSAIEHDANTASH